MITGLRICGHEIRNDRLTWNHTIVKVIARFASVSICATRNSGNKFISILPRLAGCVGCGADDCSAGSDTDRPMQTGQV